MYRPLKHGLQTSLGWGLSAFTPDDLDNVHYATLEVLEDVGIKVEASEEALEIFASGGARVERQGKDAIVRIPPHVVNDCIRWAPSNVVLKGRSPEYDYALEPYRVTFATFGEMIKVFDLETRQLRETTQQDCADIARLCDSLDEVGVVQRPVASLDKPPGTHPIYNTEALFGNTAKHVLIGPVNAPNLATIAKIAATHIGGVENFVQRPNFTTIVCPTSPLMLEKNCVDMIIASARLNGGGILCSSVPLAGATTPVTLAGTLICANAESLSALILAQLVRKGTRVIYGSVGTMMDLKTVNAAYGAPEMGMLSAASAKMAQYYRLPCLCSGIHSDSKTLDPQIGYESALGALVTALSGANIINGLGSLELGLTFDYAKFMLDIECARMIREMVAGIPITDAEMALDVIRKVGPGGEYITHAHTYDHMRERSQVTLFDRRSREAWSGLETPDIVERAYEQAKEILATHQPPPVSDEIRQEVREIIDEYLSAREGGSSEFRRATVSESSTC